MNRRRHKNKGKRTCGAVLAELALSIPLLISIGFGSIELTRLLRSYETLQSVAREIGAQAFRQCGWASEEALQNPSPCLNYIYEIQSIQAAFPEVRISLSIYELPASGGSVRLLGQYNTQGATSRYNTSTVGIFTSLTPQNNRILLTEVSMPLSSFTSIGKQFFKGSAINVTSIF